MVVPVMRSSSVSVSHVTWLTFTGPKSILTAITNTHKLALDFKANSPTDTYHAVILDPRFAETDIATYIEELGGHVYHRPPEPPSP